ncbi:hypothetical protein [Parachitinimonas caeni]|uniref:DUF3298 domain-containing protein n=1 Tax=Parachitinimonas caeni TaxID=3031301 RepID=A0ABT7E1H2_9NEIS|nr:hypothetical protein [Parachitinimonas caeni]MDK2126146.1 hypothetical protein [Parachitinimonas caeni]
MICRFWLVLALTGAALPALGDDCLTRIWKGKVGDIPVMIAFESLGADSQIGGRYYYRNQMEDLLLIRDAPSVAQWKEVDPKGRVTAYLSLTCRGDELIGEWQAADGKRRLQITAYAANAETYSRQRFEAVRPRLVERLRFGANRYERIAVAEHASHLGLRLVGNGAGLARINQTLMQDFLAALDNDIQCRAQGRWMQGEQHSYENTSEWRVIAWNRTYVVIGSQSSGYCGGAHPYSGSGAMTYDLETGQKVDISTWLTADYQQSISRDSKLWRTLIKRYRSGSEYDEACIDSLEFSASMVWPTSSGMVFQPFAPYALQFCIEEVEVPYSAIAGFLSPLGKSQVRRFQGR